MCRRSERESRKGRKCAFPKCGQTFGRKDQNRVSETPRFTNGQPQESNLDFKMLGGICLGAPYWFHLA